MRTIGIILLVQLWQASVLADSAQPVDSLVLEAKRRNDDLVKQGFNFTHRVAVAGAKLTRVEFLVPPSQGEHVVSLWFEAVEGTLTVRLVGPKEEILTSWNGRTGEQRLTRVLGNGKYLLEVKPDGAARGHGVIGVKGAVIGRCAIDTSRLSYQVAEPARGFRWPYLLLASKPIANGASEPPGTGTLLVVPNNTGFVTDDLELLRASATCELASHLGLADRLGTPLLVPLFPRPPASPPEYNLYLHALTRASLVTAAVAFSRADLQLVSMIDHARAFLAKRGIKTNSRVLMSGFSASGSFTSRFAIMHPDRILAVAVGSPGGWPIAPVETEKSETLPYPVGIGDVVTLLKVPIDLEALRRVTFFFFLGAEDDNDSVPYRDSFAASDEALINRLFGPTPVARWEAAQRLYVRAGLRARFQQYVGVGHEVTPEMKSAIEAVFRAALEKSREDVTQ